MGFLLKTLMIHVCLLTGVLCVHQISWLPCQWTDEHVFLKAGLVETELIHRMAVLQFGQKGDPPLNPKAVTFLLTGSKVDLRRYLDVEDSDELECALRRFSTEGLAVRWPVHGTQGYNYWFSCTIKHIKGFFSITSFLRQPTDQSPPGQQDYHSWPTIAETDVVTTTVAMVMKTKTPLVKTTLGSKKKLHCQFGLDHKGANFTVEWHWQHRGEKNKLFSHSSRSGLTEGTGVVLKTLAGGDASYTLHYTKMRSEGTFICSLSVNPLFASLDINLLIEEAPRVSLNVAPSLPLVEGAEQKIVCQAESYYPLDVEIVWHKEDPVVSGQRVGAPLPEVLPNILLSSHKHNLDGTYSVSAFFYLKALQKDSGRRFTCSVSHQSIRVPIKKSFILNVQDPSNWKLYLAVITLVVILCVFVPCLRK
ncbi:tapasin-related protein [Gouania willdenowi]|uniref:Tapasin-related protein-like n=1 Tax=Gouania willdenowi TaxID=441366 RepID=A0A8C5ESK6_GOUWI|nr:tapasin-related protein-like [Gouania willdenowi]